MEVLDQRDLAFSAQVGRRLLNGSSPIEKEGAEERIRE